jgi:hypothetical protein
MFGWFICLITVGSVSSLVTQLIDVDTSWTNSKPGNTIDLPNVLHPILNKTDGTLSWGATFSALQYSLTWSTTSPEHHNVTGGYGDKPLPFADECGARPLPLRAYFFQPGLTFVDGDNSVLETRIHAICTASSKCELLTSLNIIDPEIISAISPYCVMVISTRYQLALKSSPIISSILRGDKEISLSGFIPNISNYFEYGFIGYTERFRIYEEVLDVTREDIESLYTTSRYNFQNIPPSERALTPP